MTLLEFKKSGPWIKIGDRSRAQRRFDAICKTDNGLRKLAIARDAYAIEVATMYRTKMARGETLEEIAHYVLHLCTWLTRWEDYYEERTEVLHDEPTLFTAIEKVTHEQPKRENANTRAAKDFVSRKLAQTLLVDLPDVRKDSR